MLAEVSRQGRGDLIPGSEKHRWSLADSIDASKEVLRVRDSITLSSVIL